MAENVRDPRTYAIIGAAMRVHRELGCGFLEPVYQEALAIQFELDGIPFNREVEFPLFYRGRKLKATYRVDFVCYGDAPVELKALVSLSAREEAITINYLKAGRFSTGLLFNFGCRSLQYKRFVLSQTGQAIESESA